MLQWGNCCPANVSVSMYVSLSRKHSYGVRRIEALYEHLVSQHATEQHVPGDGVKMREGAVTRDQMAALLCLAEEHMITHDVHHMPHLSGHAGERTC